MVLTRYCATGKSTLFLGNLNVSWDRYTQREPDRHWVCVNIGEVSIGQMIRVDARDSENIDYEVLLEEAKTFLAKP